MRKLDFQCRVRHHRPNYSPISPQGQSHPGIPLLGVVDWFRCLDLLIPARSYWDQTDLTHRHLLLPTAGISFYVHLLQKFIFTHFVNLSHFIVLSTINRNWHYMQASEYACWALTFGTSYDQGNQRPSQEKTMGINWYRMHLCHLKWKVPFLHVPIFQQNDFIFCQTHFIVSTFSSI